MIAAAVLMAFAAPPAVGVDVPKQVVDRFIRAFLSGNSGTVRRLSARSATIGKNDIVGGRLSLRTLQQFIGDCRWERTAEQSVIRTLPDGQTVSAVDSWWRCEGESWSTRWEFDVVDGRVVLAYAGGPLPGGDAHG